MTDFELGLLVDDSFDEADSVTDDGAAAADVHAGRVAADEEVERRAAAFRAMAGVRV